MIDITQVTDRIRDLLTNKLVKPAKEIPSIILLCSLAKRPGLSCLLSFGRIIQELSKNGIKTDKMPDGTPNLMNKMIKSVVFEIYRSLKEDANIQTILPPGSENIVVTGANAGGPFTAHGVNINIGRGKALMQ